MKLPVVDNAYVKTNIWIPLINKIEQCIHLPLVAGPKAEKENRSFYHLVTCLKSIADTNIPQFVKESLHSTQVKLQYQRVRTYPGSASTQIFKSNNKNCNLLLILR